MKLVLPYTARIFMQEFYLSPANERFSVWKTCMKNIWECEMNFNSMIERLDPQTKAYRPTWEEGELLWKQGEVLLYITRPIGVQSKKTKFLMDTPTFVRRGT